MAPNTTTSPACLICEKPNSKLCGVCKSSAYCSQECQKKDWKIHKLLCKDFANFDMSARPSPDHFLGFHFPVDDEKPRCVWMKATVDVDGGVLTLYEDPQTKVVNFGDGMVKATIVMQDYFFDREIRHMINVHYTAGFLYTDYKVNKCIDKILDTNPGQFYPFKGHFTAACGYTDDMDFELTPVRRDMDMNDFRHVANFYITHGRIDINGKFHGATK
jgi:hypothetical protein